MHLLMHCAVSLLQALYPSGEGSATRILLHLPESSASYVRIRSSFKFCLFEVLTVINSSFFVLPCIVVQPHNALSNIVLCKKLCIFNAFFLISAF